MKITLMYGDKVVATNYETTSTMKKPEPKIKKEETIEEPSNLKKIIIQSSLDKMQYISFVPLDFNFPPIEEFIKKDLWNPITKTGIKEFIPEYIKTLYYVN